MADDVELGEAVVVLLADGEAPVVAEALGEADPLAVGDAESGAGDAVAEISSVPASVFSEAGVHPAATSARAAAVRAISGFFMGIRIMWEVRIWSPV